MDRSREKMKSFKLNNTGSPMVTMIVVVLFITIIATTLLYMSGMNFQIKQTDYRNQKSFYGGETALEKIRAQVMVDTSEAALVAYNHTMTNYVALGTGDARKWEYQQKFIEEIKKRWDASSGGNWMTWLSGYPFMNVDDDAALDVILEFPGRDINGDGFYTTDEMLEEHADAGYVVIKDVKVTYTDNDGYTTIIKTDFYVQAPELNWTVDNSETTAPSDPVAAMERNPVKISDFVQYVNWEKQ